MKKKTVLLVFGLVIGIFAIVSLRNLFTFKLQAAAKNQVIRVGHMPNITHMQALVGRHRKDFEQAFGSDTRIEWKVFNAGPAMMTALLAGELDLAYVGPTPAINTFLRSRGKAIEVIAGAASGGSGLVVRKNLVPAKPADFKGRKIATPQIGNSQDVACRYWLRQNGLKPKEQGGDVSVVPLAGADQLMLFKRKGIDAVWAVEPWLSRLLIEADGTLLVDERDLWPSRKYATTLLAVRSGFLGENAERVKEWLSAHVRLTDWIAANKKEAIQAASLEFEALTTKQMPQAVLDSALERLEVTTDPLEDSLAQQAQRAYEIGFLGNEPPNLEGLVNLELLKQVKEE